MPVAASAVISQILFKFLLSAVLKTNEKCISKTTKNVLKKHGVTEGKRVVLWKLDSEAEGHYR